MAQARRRWVGLWRDLGYLLWAIPSVGLTFLLVWAVVLAGMSVVVAGVGLVALPWVLVALRRWTDLHRRLASAILGTQIPGRYRPLRGGIGAWLKQVLTDRTTWRDLAWSVVQVLIGLPIAAIALTVAAGPLITLASMFFWWVPEEPVHLLTGTAINSWGRAIGLGLLNLLAIAVVSVAVPLVARSHALLTRALLGSSAAEQLAERVDVLTQTRAGVVNAHGTELARIERDLHDGTQARLVAIATRLGIAKQALADEPETVARLIQEAQDGAETAMSELRAIIRSVYPPVLTDLGLAGAVHALAAQAPVPTRVELGQMDRLPAPVEAAAYFTISEALTNVARHSQASEAVVSLSRAGDWLHMTVTDNGRGGIDETRGSGISGIRQRIAALDGTIQIDGSSGGPTSITVDLPCAS